MPASPSARTADAEAVIDLPRATASRKRALEQLGTPGVRRVIRDARELEFLDSLGLRVIFSLHEQLGHASELLSAAARVQFSASSCAPASIESLPWT
jgi:anti-anti-sigma regulatory factor